MLLAALVATQTACRPEAEPGTRAGRGSGLFSDATAELGIDVDVASGARGDHFLVETMLGGIAWIDYDGDGDHDLYIARGHEDPRHAARAGSASDRLLRNDGGRRFVDVTEAARISETRYSNGVAVGDCDGDGWSDVFVANCGRNTLLRNRGDGTFEDVTERANLVETGYSVSAVWFDRDRDGDLDLFVARYLEYDTELATPCIENGVSVYCHPRLFPGQHDLLYDNLGGATFSEVGAAAGIRRAGSSEDKGLGVIAFDHDRDGWTDLYVANDTTPNYLWRNQGDGTFREVAWRLGAATDANGRSQAGMGVDWADINGDGTFDIHVTNFAKETNSLYLSQAGGGYFDAIQQAGLGDSYQPLGFGTRIADFDLDGALDIVVANGHVDDRVESDPLRGGVRYAQPLDLYLGSGTGGFRRAGDAAGAAFAVRRVARGLATCDFDGDGDLDIAIATLDRGIVLLRNDVPAERRRMTLRLRGTASPRDAYGAIIEARIGSRRVVHEVQSARSYASAVDPRLILALGDAERIDEIRIGWPSGRVQTLRDIAPAAELTIVEE